MRNAISESNFGDALEVESFHSAPSALCIVFRLCWLTLQPRIWPRRRGAWRARAWSRRRAACLGGSARHRQRTWRARARGRWLARRWRRGIAAWRARAWSRRACHQETILGGSRRAAVLAARLGTGGVLGVRVPGVDGWLSVCGALGVRGRSRWRALAGTWRARRTAWRSAWR